ncbi:phosphoenolpyruvate carboxylase [Candidatus Woesearchaeota archaeon]|nr:phosphoenolpyruvate carboxylase [Candidatus Woesearchaeota archaeon]
MSVKTEKEGEQVSVDRMIPSTAATQLPDNVSRPFWSFKEAEDFFDCYVAFKEFQCQEYLWDWRDRKLDEVLVQKLVRAYTDFFRNKQIGSKCFITYDVAGRRSVESLGRLHMSVMGASSFAKGHRLNNPPLFEVIHSASSSSGLVRLAKLYNESVSIASDKLDRDCEPKTLSIMPMHNFSKESNWYSSLNSYVLEFQSTFRRSLDYIRPVIPRASIADKLGFVGSVLATKRALANYSSFSKITGVRSYPLLQVGPLMFRGGLAPNSLRQFVSCYPGARTLTLTCAFRYDNSIRTVRQAVSLLNQVLPKNAPIFYSKEELRKSALIEGIFSRHYKSAVRQLPVFDDILKSASRAAKNIPGNMKLSFPLYSLGIPPEMLGTGSAILECIREGHVKDLEMLYPEIKQDLISSGALLNRENLSLLAKTHKGWKNILNDVKLAEDYADTLFGPLSTSDFVHRNHTSNVFHLRASGKDFSADILAAAKARHCLG